MPGAFFLSTGPSAVTTVVTVNTPTIVNIDTGLVHAVNSALLAIGDARIDDLDDDSDRARAAKQIALDILDAKLQEHDWNFARKRAALVAQPTAPVFGYSYEFPLPTDPLCLQVLRTSLDQDASYSIELNDADQKVLLCDDSTVSIVYTARIINPTLWSPLFKQAYIAQLAHEFCYGITAKADLSNMLLGKAEKVSKNSKAKDGQEGKKGESYLSDVLTRGR